MMRMLVAGVLGGIAMYVWATVAHVATPLATMGIRPLPGGIAATAALHDRLGEAPGLYVFPGMNVPVGTETKPIPSGLIAYKPSGGGAMSPRQLGAEFGLEVVEALLTAAALSLVAGFGVRVGLAALIGLAAAISTNFSYWNWYGFSLDYTFANAIIELVKYVVAGVVIALVLGWRRRGSRRRG